MCQDAKVTVPINMIGEEAMSVGENDRGWKAKYTVSIPNVEEALKALSLRCRRFGCFK